MIEHDFIRIAVAALAKRDQELTLFGVQKHGYRLNGPLAEAEVADFEQRYAIRLPDDYRGFLTNVGNGGAGPHYGVFRLGEMDCEWEHAPWREGELVGVLCESWPHRGAWNLPKEELDVPAGLPPEEFDAVMNLRDRKYWNEALVAGAFPICHHGCALRDWLVVTGPEAGQVWHDARADDGGLHPYDRPDGGRQTFMDWYLDWLNGTLQKLGVTFVPR